MNALYSCLFLWAVFILEARLIPSRCALIHTALWMLLSAFALKELIPADVQYGFVFWAGFWHAASLQDLQTMHFGRGWMTGFLIVGLAGPFWLKADLLSRAAALIYALPVCVMVRKKAMGSADLAALAAGGWALGFERMSAALILGCLIGIFCSLFVKQRKLPMISFLAPALTAASIGGWRIYEFILLLVSF